MSQTNINIRMDEDLKKQAEHLFSEFGMNMSTAVNIFVKTVVRQGKIPFEISIVNDDFYNSYNQERLKRTIANANSSKSIVKTLDELEAMSNE